MQMWGVSVRRRPWLCIIELMKYGDVLSVVKACKFSTIQITLSEQLRICAQTADGMAHVASNGYVHMDLAARNILVGPGLLCKVADFGLTRKVDRENRDQYVQTEKMKVPMKWMSPESMDNRLWSQKSDVWSFGISMWEIFSYGEVPFAEMRNLDYQTKARGKKGVRLPMPPACNPNVYAVMMRCWDHLASARPTFSDLSTIFIRLLEPAVQAVRSSIFPLGFLLSSALTGSHGQAPASPPSLGLFLQWRGEPQPPLPCVAHAPRPKGAGARSGGAACRGAAADTILSKRRRRGGCQNENEDAREEEEEGEDDLFKHG
jgi:serine/threonine protein kinase